MYLSLFITFTWTTGTTELLILTYIYMCIGPTSLYVLRSFNLFHWNICILVALHSYLIGTRENVSLLIGMEQRLTHLYLIIYMCTGLVCLLDDDSTSTYMYMYMYKLDWREATCIYSTSLYTIEKDLSYHVSDFPYLSTEDLRSISTHVYLSILEQQEEHVSPERESHVSDISIWLGPTCISLYTLIQPNNRTTHEWPAREIHVYLRKWRKKGYSINSGRTKARWAEWRGLYCKVEEVKLWGSTQSSSFSLLSYL